MEDAEEEDDDSRRAALGVRRHLGSGALWAVGARSSRRWAAGAVGGAGAEGSRAWSSSEVVRSRWLAVSGGVDGRLRRATGTEVSGLGWGVGGGWVERAGWLFGPVELGGSGCDGSAALRLVAGAR